MDEYQRVNSDPCKVSCSRGFEWITEGWRLVKPRLGTQIAVTLLLVALEIAIGFVPLVGALVSPFINALLIGGWLLLMRRAQLGEAVRAADLLQIFSHRAVVPLITTTALYFGLTLASLLMISIALGTGTELFSLMAGEGAEGVTDDVLAGSLVTGLLLFSLTLLPIMAMYWFAIPLVLFSDTPPWMAMKQSLSAVFINTLPMLAYGLVGFFMLFLASLPLMLGLLIALPVLIASWLISYEDIFASES